MSDHGRMIFAVERKGVKMIKRILMLIFILVILNTLTGCGNTTSRRPSVLIDTNEFEACKRIDIGSKYEYVNFDVIETTTGKDVIVHFERRSDDQS
jgi:hypothetical protein